VRNDEGKGGIFYVKDRWWRNWNWHKRKMLYKYG